MARYAYERLSAQDAAFLLSEQPNQPMHVGAVAIVDAEPLARPGGGIDIDAYRAAVESVLHWIPRYRQKIQWTPVEGWPVWVDDRGFDIGYHIRHIARPGREGSTSSRNSSVASTHDRSIAATRCGRSG